MTKTEKVKTYDLEDRTYKFAANVRLFTKKLPKIKENFEDCKQVIRSSGSVGANYIEANEALSKKDFIHRIKISRKEAKETIYWLKLIDTGKNESLNKKRMELIKEGTELMKIFGSIIVKSK